MIKLIISKSLLMILYEWYERSDLKSSSFKPIFKSSSIYIYTGFILMFLDIFESVIYKYLTLFWQNNIIFCILIII